jgi:vacuolar protein sorting-associated protein VTA1
VTYAVSPLVQRQMNEKLKYSKWKAADIAKALREGRKPTPGAANEEEDDIQDSANVEALTGTQEAAARLATLDATHPDTEQDYIDREMAKLTAAQDVMDAEDNPDNVVTAISPDVPPHPGQFQMSREQSRLSIDERAPAEKATVGAAAAEEDDASMQIGSPNFSRPLSIISPSPSFGELQGEHSYLQHNNRNLGGASSPKPRPLPVVPGSNNSSFRGRESLPIPPGGGNTNPLEPPSRLISPGLPPHSIDTSPASGTLPSRPTIPTTSFPSAPPAPTPIIPTLASSLSSSSLIPTSTTASAPANLPSSLDPTAISRVQKLARWAISALDYDDVDTARKQLTEALEICDGKKVAQGRK